ncbi:hypothetical protein RHECNPAF_4310019 [Rhizobium etli CNPAF512]|nr:hypothetical protein RHECNPAF_4310019 [Rhizobium etli CNPAF512]
MIEYAGIRVINAADIIDDPVLPWRDPSRRPAADQARLRKKPGQDDARQQFVGMEATGMGDEEIGDHENYAPCRSQQVRLRGPNQIAVAGHDLNPSLRIPQGASQLPERAAVLRSNDMSEGQL